MVEMPPQCRNSDDRSSGGRHRAASERSRDRRTEPNPVSLLLPYRGARKPSRCLSCRLWLISLVQFCAVGGGERRRLIRVSGGRRCGEVQERQELLQDARG